MRMSRWAIPSVGGALLALALAIHGSARPTPAPARAAARPAVPAAAGALSAPSRVAEHELPVLPEGDLREDLTLPARREILREVFWKYRSVVACDDEEGERELYPLLLLDRGSSLECARDEVAQAPTELDRQLSLKAEEALLKRIAESEGDR